MPTNKSHDETFVDHVNPKEVHVDSLFTSKCDVSKRQQLYHTQGRYVDVMEQTHAKKAAEREALKTQDGGRYLGVVPESFERYNGVFGNQWNDETRSNESRMLFHTFKGLVCKHGKRAVAEGLCEHAIDLFEAKYAEKEREKENSLSESFTGGICPDPTSHSYEFGVSLRPVDPTSMSSSGYAFVQAGIPGHDEHGKGFMPVERLSHSVRGKTQFEPQYRPDHVKKARSYPLVSDSGSVILGKAHASTRIGGRARDALTRNGSAVASKAQSERALRYVVDLCKPAVERVSIRQGARSMSRPVGRTPIRQDTVALRTLIKNASKRKTGSLASKLAQEMFEVSQGRASNATLRAKTTAHRLAAANRGQLT